MGSDIATVILPSYVRESGMTLSLAATFSGIIERAFWLGLSFTSEIKGMSSCALSASARCISVR